MNVKGFHLHRVTQARPGDVMRHTQLDKTVDVIDTRGNWVEFVDRANYNSLCWLEEDVFLEHYMWVRNSPVLLSTWAEKRPTMLAEARALGLAVPKEFSA